MNSFSIGDAWSHAVAFLKDNLQMLAIIVGGGILVSSVLQYLASGGVDQTQQMAALTEAMSSGDFGKLANSSNAGLGLGGGIFVIVGMLIQSATQFAAMRLGLARDDEATGPALSYGLSAAVILVLFFIVVGLVAAIVIIAPIAAIAAGGGLASGGAPSGGVVALIVLLSIAAFVLIIWVSIRLAVMQPAMAAERSTNPIYGIKESWRLTRGNAGMIFLYSMLLGVVMLVIMMVVGSIVGLIGAALGPVGAAIMSAILVTAPFSIVSLAVSVGMYQTLTPDTRYDIFN